jgi:hypothetical protein
MRRLIGVVALLFCCVILLSPLKRAGAASNELSILLQPWHLSGSQSASEKYQVIASDVFAEASSIRITYDLHGLCAYPGDASAIIIDQQGWKSIALADYGSNCMNGPQTIEVPMTDFTDVGDGSAFDTALANDGLIHVRFWHYEAFEVEIDDITVMYTSETTEGAATAGFAGITALDEVSGVITVSYETYPHMTERVAFYIDDELVNRTNQSPYQLGSSVDGVYAGFDTTGISNGKHLLSVIVLATGSYPSYTDSIEFVVNNNNDSFSPSPSPEPRPTPTPVSTLSPTGSWEIQSVDAMKDTKDSICGPRDKQWIEQWVDRAVELGANYVAISQPYDDPDCGPVLPDTRQWVEVIRSRGLKVWHRHMPLAFEGIYSVPKDNSDDYLSIIKDYIVSNPDVFAEGDIFTPIPEPQNGGIQGITYCAQNVCQFSSAADFNAWLRDAMTVSKQAFEVIGKNNMKIGYYGFDGFVAWGANNPDWNGILEDATVVQMGNITIDHYPDLIDTNMATDLTELEARYPGVDIIIGEWGSVTGVDSEAVVKRTMEAARRPSIKGFNYWQFGPSGAGEQLIGSDFSRHPHFDEVQFFFTGQ